jgi:hypothetical protein
MTRRFEDQDLEEDRPFSWRELLGGLVGAVALFCGAYFLGLWLIAALTAYSA